MEKRSAFTLVELLIVIAIIGILAGLIATAANRLRASAQEQQCRNNLKQLHAAVLSYALENGDALPHAMLYETIERGYRGIRGWVTASPVVGGGDVATLNAFLTGKSRREPSTQPFWYDLGTGPLARFCIENGEIYQYMKDLSAYACPVMRSQVMERAARAGTDTEDDWETDGKPPPGKLVIYRTYAMNSFFGSADGEYLRDMNTWGAETLTVSSIGGTSPAYTAYYIDNCTGSKPRAHRPEPSKLLLFSEVVPAYKNDDYAGGDKLSWVSGVTGAGNRTTRSKLPRDKKRSGDCCLAPEKFDSKYERIGFDYNDDWDKTGMAPGYQYGAHPTGLMKQVNGKNTEIMGSLAMFLDGHIEKVFANTDGEVSGANTAWFYNHGLLPANKHPTATNIPAKD